ncbi:hypothetical protein C5167_029736 [Papaver somniferum]|nr:hypothetical protein C5167_029736 [Papaver somniferum]
MVALREVFSHPSVRFLSSDADDSNPVHESLQIMVVINHHKNEASFVCKYAAVGNTTSANSDCWKLAFVFCFDCQSC